MSFLAKDCIIVAAVSRVCTKGGGGIMGSSGPRASAFESRFFFFFPFGFVVKRMILSIDLQIPQKPHEKHRYLRHDDFDCLTVSTESSKWLLSFSIDSASSSGRKYMGWEAEPQHL